ncbi:MAG: methyltransferase domain-containing protein [Actinobacteria bacterium]|nr:methyltransferase domain-containing protein [Actinomycetota bacterium]
MTTASEVIPTGNAYDKYGTSNPIERRMMAGFFDAFDGFVAKSNPSSVLEVGAGEGSIARRLLERNPDLGITILDLPDPELASHWAGLEVAQVQGSVEELPFPDRSMDLILAIEVLEHVVHPEVALAEIARVADREVILSVPREPIWRIGNLARGRYLSDLGNTPGHIQHWSKHTFAALVGRHFEVLSVAAPLPWTMIHARRLER